MHMGVAAELLPAQVTAVALQAEGPPKVAVITAPHMGKAKPSRTDWKKFVGGNFRE